MQFYTLSNHSQSPHFFAPRNHESALFLWISLFWIFHINESCDVQPFMWGLFPLSAVVLVHFPLLWQSSWWWVICKEKRFALALLWSLGNARLGSCFWCSQVRTHQLMVQTGREMGTCGWKQSPGSKNQAQTETLNCLHTLLCVTHLMPWEEGLTPACWQGPFVRAIAPEGMSFGGDKPCSGHSSEVFRFIRVGIHLPVYGLVITMWVCQSLIMQSHIRSHWR